MKYRKALLLVMLISFQILCIAQDTRTDSLLTSLLSAENDSLKVKTLNALADHLRRSDPSDAIDFGSQARELAEKLNDQKGLALALKNIGLGHYMQGNYVEASVHWEQSLEILESIGDESGIANLIGNLGAVHSTLGDIAKAIEFYLRSLKMSEDLGDSIRMATCLLNIGVVYSDKSSTYDKALEYYMRALKISESINYPDAIGMSSFNLGETYYRKGEFESALIYFEKSMGIYENSVVVAASLNYIGKIYAEKGSHETAVSYQTKAFEMAESFNAKLVMAESLLGLADTYKKNENTKLAINFFEQAEVIAKEIGSDYELKDAYEGLALSYAEVSDFRNAFKYQTLLSQITETIFNIKTDDKIKNLQFSFQLDKKEVEIENLEQKSEIEQLNTKRQKLIKNISLAGFGVILVIAFLLYRSYKHKVKTNQLLDQQNEEIEGLLLNILPEETAKELQKDGYATPRYYDRASVLFTDFKGFTKIAEGLKPHELIAELNSFFNAFDDIVEKYKLEKIKTIGDAYMCAGGIPTSNETHPVRIAKAGLEMQEYMKLKNEQRTKQGMQIWELRVGIHTGPIVAGVVGKKKYAYDIWGDTVNIASRMESNGEVGKVNVSAATYELVKDHFSCTYRGKIEAKNKGLIDMYFIGKENGLSQA